MIEDRLPSLEEIDERLELDDYEAAFDMAKRRRAALDEEPELERIVSVCIAALRGLYLERLGSMEARLVVIMPASEMRWQQLDHRAGFVVSRIVDPTTVGELLDLSGMPEIDTLRILCKLRMQGVIDAVAP